MPESRVPRVEGREKVTGTARYTYDVRPPGMLFAKVLRSPFPHARIRSIETTEASALPGVRAIVSHVNAGDIPWYETSRIFDRTVRFIGDEVAAVAAETEEAAEDALRLMHVEYERLPFVAALEDAMQPGAHAVYESGNRAGEGHTYERGSVQAGFAEADVLIDEVYTTQSALHNAFEPHGATASWEGDHLTLWTSTQSVFEVRAMVADALGMRLDNVRVITEHMGGGFGAKQVAWKHDVIAALLARQAGQPVQLMLDRDAENLAVGNRNPSRQHVRLSARRDGTLTAIQAEIQANIGAYKISGEGSNIAGIYQMLYRCPNVGTRQEAFFTNTGPAVAFRAPGFVEGAFGLESAMDELARALEMDPLELRRLNYTEADQTSGKPYTTRGLAACYDAASRAFGWPDGVRERSSGPRRRGSGMAANIWIGGSGYPPAYAWIKLNADGTAAVITGTQDIGTGTRTGLSQVAAEALGLPVEDIALHLGDTERGPYAPVSSGSATQATLGPAICEAADEVKRNAVSRAAEELEVPPGSLTIEGAEIRSRDNPALTISIKELCKRIDPEMIQGFGGRPANPKDKSVRTFSAQFAEVEVDTETGEITVVRLVTANDAGRIINQLMVDSQVVGGIAQGTGFALLEERVVDAKLGVVLNANMEEYKLPSVLDIPKTEHATVDLPDYEANRTGAKGIGEPPLVATAPAIANAVFDAVGLRIRDLPLSRWKVLERLEEPHA